MFYWLTVGGSVLIGFIVGRWWALLAPPALAVIVFNAEADSGNDLAALAFLWGAFLFIGAAIGVILRKLLRTTPRDEVSSYEAGALFGVSLVLVFIIGWVLFGLWSLGKEHEP